jgi:hypothetical protein
METSEGGVVVRGTATMTTATVLHDTDSVGGRMVDRAEGTMLTR